MELMRSTARAMHDDHMAALNLLERVEQVLAQTTASVRPDRNSTEWRRLLADFRAAVEHEISGHFAFEEEALFPIMNEYGAEGMSCLLMDQHKVLLPLGKRLAELAGEAERNGFTTDTWPEFRKCAGEFVDGLRGHIDMEETELAPALEEDQDAELIQSYRF